MGIYNGHLTSNQLAIVWATGIAYGVNDVVINSSLMYICLVSHTSGATFAADLALAYWTPVSGSSFTTFLIANNQASYTNVTGFSVNPTTTPSFTSESLVKRYHKNILTDTEDTVFYTALGGALAGTGRAGVQLASKDLVIASTSTFNGNAASGLVKLTAAGAEVAAFTTNLGTGFNAAVTTVVEQADLKLVAGGVFTSLNGTTRNRLVRLNANGTVDTAFYTNLGTGFGTSQVYDIGLQADQKIVAGGDFVSFNSNTRNKLVRINADGTEDTAFYTNLGTGFSGGDVWTVCVQADQKIVVGGTFTSFNGNARNRMVRLNANGTEDTAFYTNLGTAFDSTVIDILQQPLDQKLVVVGNFANFNSVARGAVVRLNASGTEDAAFATATGTGFNTTTYSIGYQNGSLVIGGAFTTVNGTSSNRLARLTSTGAPDLAFTAALGIGFNGTVFSVVVQQNDQVVLLGNFTDFNLFTRNRIVRYELSQDVELMSQSTIKGVYKISTDSWSIATSGSAGDVTGVLFQMTAAGQLQYKSSNIAGALVSSYIKFQVTGI
jgi:uncharacterized delta-60 repeat protein